MLNNMIPNDAKLNPDVFDTSKLEQKPTRDGFGKGLVAAGKSDERVLALCADLAESTRVEWFQKEFPHRYIEIGVAEQNLATIAAGMANYGKIPFITSYATFSPGRNWEQIRTTICINNVPVKIAGSHAGISVGPDGATHQALEDIALMRALPRMAVLNPCDAIEAEKATIAAAQTGTPVYIRLGREKTPVFTTAETPFAIGKAQVLYSSDKKDVGIIATGSLVHNALLAAKQLEQQGIGASVMNLATIKPLDGAAVEAFAREHGALVTVEEHQIAGGMGSAVAEHVVQTIPTPIEFIGMHDEFGQSGKPTELIEYYKMGVSHIMDAAKKVMQKKTL